jgi:3'-5' exoribonuclease
MKIHEYEMIYGSETRELACIRKTSYRNLVRHVAGSHAEFVRRMEKHRHMFSEERYMNIEHTILAHHGRKECGSPIEPQTVEAYILHYADMYSVKFGPGR